MMLDQFDKPTIEILNKPLPEWAVKPNKFKPGMSTIHPMAVIDRLNEAFGVGAWSFLVEFISCDKAIQKTSKGDRDVFISAVKGRLEIGKLIIEQFGGSTNDDRGDAIKGGATDALTKIASYLGVAAAIYKNQGNHENEIDEVLDETADIEKKEPNDPARAPAEMITDKQLTLLAMLMKEQGIDERDIYTEFGVESRKGLTKKQASMVIDRLVKSSTAPMPVKTVQKASKLDVARIRMLMAELNMTPAGEENLLAHFSVGHLEDLNPAQAYQAIVELTRQKETKAYNADPVMSSINNI